MKKITEKTDQSVDVTQTPQFQAWFAGSKVVDQTGNPIKLYRGLRGSYLDRVEHMSGRPTYAMFFSSNPAIANTYGNIHGDHSMFRDMPDNQGAVFPVYVKATKLIEFPVRAGRFDMFEFDRIAKTLGAGQGVVARGIVDPGPMGSDEVDPKKLWSYPADTYSFGPGTSIKSAVGNRGAFNPDDPRMVESVINTESVRILSKMKTFYEILAEKDDEHTYTIHSTADIHRPELCARIKLSLIPYEIKSFECDGYRPLSKNNDMFPEEPNSPTYTIKVITRYPLTKGFLSILAMDAHIHIAHLKITPDDSVDPVNEPEEISSEESQKTAGSKRLGAFIKELQTDRKARNEMTWSREVYECFYVTHRALEKVVNKPVRNGYYMVESYTDHGKKYLKAEGPFAIRGVETPFRDRIRPLNPQVVSETSNGGLYCFDVLVEDFEKK